MKLKPFLFALLAQLFSLTAMAYDAEIDGIYYDFSGTQATVVSGDNRYSGSITIPSSVSYNGTTYEVTEIGVYAFEWCNISSVNIPNSVTTIGDAAFNWCGILKSIIIPNSVTNIGIEAFRYCDVLSTITIPESVTTIGGYAFENTAWYEQQPDGLVYAGKVAYRYKGTMPENTTIDIREGTLSIASYAFQNCSGLTSITFPESVISIGEEAFNGTAWFENQPDGLVYAGKVAYKYKGTMPENTTIDVKEGTLVIADNAFQSCYNLTSITLPESLTSIGNSSFSGTGLSSIIIPNAVTSIGSYAFNSSNTLRSIVIPAGVTSIGVNAFDSNSLSSIVVEADNTVYDSRDDCNAIIETSTNTLIKGCINTIIPNSVSAIGSDAFHGCYCLTSITIPESVTSIENYAFSGCNLHSVTIPEGVTSIGESAFQHCSSLTSITIPKSLTSIGKWAFLYDNSLSSIVVEEGNLVYDSRNGCNALIETATNTLIKGCKNTIIPNSVTAIGSEAFNYCHDLTTITIPESVISIGGGAFAESGLTSVNIPNTITSIDYGAFNGTPWFENQPEGLIYVGKVAYTYKGTMPENTSINLQEGTTGIAGVAFSGCSGLISITIPSSVTYIGGSAFGGCNNLKSINIPDNVTEIGYGTFWDCHSLASITIPKGVTSIGDYAFMGCYSLTSITLPEDLISIGDDAFNGCTNISSITIPEGVTNIGDMAFYMCSNLKTVIIPSSVTYIGRDAFAAIQYGLVKSEMRTPVPVTHNTLHFAGKLYVPKGCKAAYQAADVWKEISEIIECDYVDVPEQTILAGGSTTMEIEVNNFDTDIVAFQMDLTLPEGVSIDKTGCSLSSRITDEEQELTIGKLENGAYRLTSSSLSLTPISGNNGTLLTLKLTTTEDSDDGQATISNIRFSTADSKRIEMDDVSFNIDIVQKYKLTYIVDGEVYKTYDVLETTQLTLEEEPIKEGYTFSGWSELPETMPAHDVEVTGSFSVNSYTLTYIVDGEVYKTDTVEYGTTLSAEEPTKEGFTFGGWSEIPETMPAQDVVVTGSFTINSYNLTYIVDGEVFKTSSVVYGTELTPEAEPTKDGYTFGGWSELAETMPAYDVVVTGGFYLYGDVNTDDEVDVVDVVDIARFVVATPSVKFREKLADLNYDNSVNIGDAVTLVNYIAGDQNFVKEMFAPEQNTVADALSLTKNGKAIALNLTNGRAYTAFQFDLYVQEDANITKMMLNSHRKQKHQLLYNKVEDGHYRVAALSISNNTFQGTEGELLSFVMDDELGAEVEIGNIHFFDTKGNDYALDVIGIDQETGVMSMQETETSGAIYDLQGRKLSKMQRGVNIVDGKKVIMK